MLMVLIGLLPYRWAGTCGRAFGVLVFNLAGRERQKTLHNIQIAFPKGMSREQVEKLALSVWARLGLDLCEVVRWLKWPHDKIASQVVRERGWENIEKALA